MNATATAPARQRKAQVKAARSIRLEVRPEDNGLGIVRINVGKEHANYFLTLIPADFGRGFKVEKIGLTCNDPLYHVNIDGDTKTCECKASCVTGTASTVTDSRP